MKCSKLWLRRMGLNKDFHSRKLVMSDLMGIRLAIFKITRLGVVAVDEEAKTEVEDDSEETKVDEGML